MEIGIRTDLPAPKQDAQSVLKDIHISRSLAHGVGKYLSDACTVIYIAVNDSLAGYIVLADTIRSETPTWFGHFMR